MLRLAGILVDCAKVVDGRGREQAGNTPAPACKQYLDPIIIYLKNRTRTEARVQVPVQGTAYSLLVLGVFTCMCERWRLLSKFLDSNTWVSENCISIKLLLAPGHKILLPAQEFLLPLHYAVGVFGHYRTDIMKKWCQVLLLIQCLISCQHISHNIPLHWSWTNWEDGRAVISSLLCTFLI